MKVSVYRKLYAFAFWSCFAMNVSCAVINACFRNWHACLGWASAVMWMLSFHAWKMACRKWRELFDPESMLNKMLDAECDSLLREKSERGKEVAQ